jgi:pimeloyl-ACP methyl ester carboxylesterase
MNLIEIRNHTWKGCREKPLILDAFWPEGLAKLPVVLFAHGYKGFKDWGAWDLFGKKIAKAGFLFIKFNFSFNGGSLEQPIDFPDLEAFGNNNYSTEVGDISRMIDFIYRSNALPRERLEVTNTTLIGHSRGGGMAILAAGLDNRINKLITLAAISDLVRRQPTGALLERWKRNGVSYVMNKRTGQQMPHFYQMHEDYMRNLHIFDIPMMARKISIPWLIVHGTNDEAVSFSEAEELRSFNPKSAFEVMEGVNHVFGAKHPWTENELPEDLNKVLFRVTGFLKA